MRIGLIVLLWATAVSGQPLLPQCGPGLDGQVSGGGCTCRHRSASLLAAQPAGWRWDCDLLRQGAAPDHFAQPEPPPPLPNGFAYMPQSQSQPQVMAHPGY